jgi:hypothetical protein
MGEAAPPSAGLVTAPPPSGDATGVTDTARLQAALHALSPGRFLALQDSGYVVNQPLQMRNATGLIGPAASRPGKPRAAPVPPAATIVAAAGANLPAVLTDTAYPTTAASPVPSSSIMIRGVIIDGNAANQTGGAGYGIALLTRASAIEDCTVQNTRGSGIVLADQNAGGSPTAAGSQVENGIFRCNVYKPGGGYGIWVQRHVSTLTDGYLTECIVDCYFTGTAIGVQMDNMAGWRVFRNHVYACQGDAYVFNHCSNAWIVDNFADNFGQASLPNVTYHGYQVQLAPFGRTTVRGNKTNCAEAGRGGGGAGTFVHYSVAAAGAGRRNEVTFSDNAVHQSSATSATSTAYRFASGNGGALAVQQFGGVSLSATTTSPYPVLSGTVTFPGCYLGATRYAPADPAGTTSQHPTFVMAGLALAVTPQVTGKLKILISGGAGTPAGAATVAIQGRYGAGTPPRGGGMSAGTAFGQTQAVRALAGTTGWSSAFIVADTISGLTPGTAYWVDLAFSTSAGADQARAGAIIAVIEEVC